MATIQQQLSSLSQTFQSIQQKLQVTVDSRQRLEAQSQENESVKSAVMRKQTQRARLTLIQELDALPDDAAIYKLIGPVLVKQDPLESKQNVARRIELLQAEIVRVEGELRGGQREAERVKEEIIRIQGEGEGRRGEGEGEGEGSAGESSDP